MDGTETWTQETQRNTHRQTDICVFACYTEATDGQNRGMDTQAKPDRTDAPPKAQRDT